MVLVWLETLVRLRTFVRLQTPVLFRGFRVLVRGVPRSVGFLSLACFCSRSALRVLQVTGLRGCGLRVCRLRVCGLTNVGFGVVLIFWSLSGVRGFGAWLFAQLASPEESHNVTTVPTSTAFEPAT